MKRLKFLMIGLFLSLMVIGCSDKPPKYDGEKAEVYGEKVGSYYGDKLKEAGAKNIREYLNKSQNIISNLKQNIQNLNNEQLVEKIDDTIKQLINLSDEYLGITEEDYKFFVNPLKYYGLYDDYDNFTQAVIGNSGPQIWYQLAYVIGMSYGGKFYSPFDIGLKDILGNKEQKYYYVLKHTKYKQFLNDNSWLKDYEAKKNILDTAIQIAKKEKLYFDIELDGYGNIKDKSHEINSLLKEKKTAQNHLQHNIKIFIKTFKTLLQQGYKDYTISKYLTNNRHTAYKNDILSINMNKKIKLGHLTGMAFDDYIEYMKKILSKNK